MRIARRAKYETQPSFKGYEEVHVTKKGYTRYALAFHRGMLLKLRLVLDLLKMLTSFRRKLNFTARDEPHPFGEVRDEDKDKC